MIDSPDGIRGYLFDLDGTLTDYIRSSRRGLEMAYETYFQKASDSNPAVSFRRFAANYMKIINSEIKTTSENGMTLSALETRKQRFAKLLSKLNCSHSEILEPMSFAYGKGRSMGAVLFKGAKSTLSKLKSKFKLGLITEGAHDTQMNQLNNLNLTGYFDAVIISGDTPFHKPALELYQIAIDALSLHPSQIVMVGDRPDWDLRPAKKLGMHTVFFKNAESKVRYNPSDPNIDAVITRLSQLIDLSKDKDFKWR